MRTADGTVGALLVGALAVICCAGPLFVAAIGTTALAAWFSYSGYALIAAVLIAATGGLLWFRHRRSNAPDCSRPEDSKASKHERLLRANEQKQGL
jgi:hypothetical protein